MNTSFTIPELVIMAVQKKQLPQYLYKYRALNSNFESILLNNELWFSTPTDFNDPFDCQISIDTNNTQLEIEQFILNNTKSRLPQAEVRRLAENMINSPEKWSQAVKAAVQRQLNSIGICCFAGNGKSILLWSHYADSHKGVCLKFNVLNDPVFFTSPMNVKYQTDYPRYNHLKDQTKIIEQLVVTKSKVWDYEEEVRILKLINGLHKFRKSSLVEIAFGCKCSDVIIYRVKETLISNGLSHVILKKALVKADQYDLDFIDIPH